MSKQWIFIEPHDVWMFRDSKPFTAGESFFARSLFPPQPGTVQGMIRTYYYEQTGQIIGSSTDLGALRLMGAFLAQRVDKTISRVYPCPLDLLLLENQPPRPLMPLRDAHFVTDLTGSGWSPLSLREPLKDTDKTDDGLYWLDQMSFSRYLMGEPVKTLIPSSALYEFEERTGLAMDHSRRAYRRRRDDSPEGLFYRAAFVRPKPAVGLLVGVDHPKPIFGTTTGALAVGGESRMGEYRVVQYTEPNVPVRQGRIKLVLLTPAYFKNGWLPEDFSPWMGSQAHLISAAVGKPLAFSGWDMAANQPKTLRHFVPAGSVYYFENATPPQTPFTETPDHEPDFGTIGYGAFAAAAWNYLD